MEIDTQQAVELGVLILFVLIFTIILNAFYPSDFSVFDSSLLTEPIKFDAVTIGGWATILGVACAVGFFTSGNSLYLAVTGIILSIMIAFYPIFVYLVNVLTLGMFNYPNYDIHKDTPIVLLLFIAIPASVIIFYLAFDLVTSALHSAVGGD